MLLLSFLLLLLFLSSILLVLILSFCFLFSSFFSGSMFFEFNCFMLLLSFLLLLLFLSSILLGLFKFILIHRIFFYCFTFSTLFMTGYSSCNLLGKRLIFIT